jgi:O-acetyl-ADP-ribose deacetylase (regulator of RNase III)
MIEFVKGDILAADVEAVVNPANAHGVMGGRSGAPVQEQVPRECSPNTNAVAQPASSALAR